MEGHAPEVSALRRKLLWYRVILGAVAVGLVIAALLRRPTPTPDIEVFDVSAQIDDLAREHPDWPDIVPPPYLSTNAATVHLHLMSARQVCPLHLHESTEEATVIVRGLADTVHVFGSGGATSLSAGRRRPGTLLYMPPYSGHEWRNASTDAPLGNLVFTAPRFTGNRYVDRDDPRLRQGREPIVIDLEAEQAQTMPGGRRERPLPFAGNRLRLLITDLEERIEPREGPVIVYAISGAGRLDAARSIPLAPSRLIVLRDRHPALLHPDAGSRLSLIIFQAPP